MASRRRLLLRVSLPRTTIAAALACHLTCLWLLAGSVYALDPNKRLTQYSHKSVRLQDGAAQAAASEGQRIIHESWTFKEGAPEAAEALAQTTDGYLWVGTQSGLFRFDGVRFEPFRSPLGDQLLSNNVSALFAPATGGLWVGYRFGGFSFLKNGRVTNFPGAAATVCGFAQDQHGIVWAATLTRTGGLWRFDGSSWQNITGEWNAPPMQTSQVGFDREGILWVLTETRGEVGKQLFYLPPDSRQFRKAGDNLVVESFTWDADHTVLTTHDRSTQEPASGVELESSLPAYPILKKDSAQILDRANSIWFVPRVEPGIWRHPAGEPMAEIVSKASRNNSQVYDINPYRFAFLVDREGSVWIGDQKGVHRFSYSPLMELALPTNVDAFALVPDEDGVVWVSAGNRNGSSNLYRVAGGKGKLQKSQAGVANFAYRAGDKTLWFGGEGGLWHMVNGSLTRIDLPPALAEGPQYLQTIAQDRVGGMWVSFGSRALYRFADDTWTVNGGHHDPPISVVISEFTDNLGRVWFGGLKNQLAVLDGDRVKTFGPNEGIRVGAITAIYGRGSGIWVGGEFGLQHFDQGRFHAINAVERESLRGISGIVETTNGDLWLNGLGGVFHIRRAEIMEALKNPAYLVSGERFGRREGSPGLPPQLRPIPTAIEGTDGRLWFAGSDGVVWLDPARASNRTPPPPVTIESVSADDQGYRVDLPIRFPAHTSSVQITYAAVSLADSEAIRFRYKVREIDRDWHEAGTSTSVNYRNLPPGSYHFLVNTSDTNGLWSDNTATAEFTVLPAFYQTNWFRALCVGAFLAMLWMAYQVRVRHLQRQFDMTLEARVGERTRIARDLHDTLLQSFHGLLFRFQAARNMLPNRPEEATQALDTALIRAEQALDEGRHSIQGLRANPSAENDLDQMLIATGQELASSNHAEDGSPRFEVIVEGERRGLPPMIKDEIGRIARELLRNAFRHARAREIEVEIRYENDVFRLVVRDDGKGVDPKILQDGGRAGHWGLPGVQERARGIGARLEFLSEAGAGTEIRLTLPAAIAYEKPRNGDRFSLFRKRRIHEHQS